jgi:hypothetical protein
VTQRRLLAGYRSTLRLPQPEGARPVDCSIVVECLFCDFWARVPPEQAAAAFEQHVCDRPKVTVSKRRRSGFAGASKLLDPACSGPGYAGPGRRKFVVPLPNFASASCGRRRS